MLAVSELCAHPMEARQVVGRPGDIWLVCMDCHHEVKERRSVPKSFVALPRCENTNDCIERQRIQYQRGRESVGGGFREDAMRIIGGLRDALSKYGWHEHTCGALGMTISGSPTKANARAQLLASFSRCTCGFAQALLASEDDTLDSDS